jgi:hypothetical protein
MCDTNNATSGQAEFTRGLREPVEKLRATDLFQNKLEKDIHDGEVFFAIRYGYASFYYKGSSLFTYEKSGFATHQKFGFIPDELQDAYIGEDELAKLRPIQKFTDGYEKIKERAKLYAGAEAEGVSALYKFAPTPKHLEGRYFLVDIEIAFPRDDKNAAGRRTTDRVDILLYDNVERQLLFCEAKHYSSKEIWPNSRGEHAVTGQLARYDQQIMRNQAAILEQYKIAFDEYNSLLGAGLHAPEKVFPQCGLLIFGFDSDGLNKLKGILGQFPGRPYRIIGDMQGSSATVKNLYETLTSHLWC